jgi:hypothetical protein
LGAKEVSVDVRHKHIRKGAKGASKVVSKEDGYRTRAELAQRTERSPFSWTMALKESDAR